MRKRCVEEYLKEIESSEDKVDCMTNILKSEKRTIFNIISSILTTILLILVIFMQVNNYYNKTEIIVDQSGDILCANKNYEYIKERYDINEEKRIGFELDTEESFKEDYKEIEK